MVGLQLLPAVLSLLVLGAHFLRSGSMLLLLLVLAVTFSLLAVRRPWAARLAQATLVLGTLEWVRTLVGLAAERAQAGQPAQRMVLILAGVALVTAASAILLSMGRLRQRYRLDEAPAETA